MAASGTPQEATVVCGFCSQGRNLYVFPIDPRWTHTRCPNCRRSYRLLTRYVTQVQARADRRGRRHYDFLTREPGGRERMRTAASATALKMQPNHWFTFVWRGNRLVGVADQDEGFWLTVKPLPRNASFDHLWQLITWVCLILAALQASRLLGFTYDTVSSHPWSLFLLILFGLLLLAPVAQWALNVASGAEEEEEEIVDPFAQQPR